MQRRAALKTFALSIGSTLVLPSWANAWSNETLHTTDTILSSTQEALLAEIVGTIIPKTDTPGAKELNVDKFVTLMVADCYDAKAQDTFAKGLLAADEIAKKDYSKAFSATEPAQRLAVLNKMDKSGSDTEKGFIRLVKNLTIQGYLNSEYVMTNLRVFEFIPGRYHGCVPVKVQAGK
ncbi:gluconate 2-dehydrogenase subunit 3 family protein [Emticicia sp. C21]|uniref:gluconate 2-dehydrogenase subunit 3 family protein n=1 Tax=Emticicia sp. C21 TaxID=2302915 RepID=UPI000E34D0A4|nr:gluconate 2-dehydrogenase subunit 3 family protein [Emticicia sp. C21]RFS18532.1 gluconate 2-dehydrogenase subunit 3 family protein [Emticicia sp. C21]